MLTEFITVDPSDISKSLLGRVNNLYAVPNKVISASFFSTPAFRPRHGLGLNGSAVQIDEQVDAFLAGAAGNQGAPAIAKIQAGGTLFIPGTINEITLVLVVAGFP